MGIFGKSPRMFYSVFADEGFCRIYLREFGKNKKLIKEDNQEMVLVDKELVENINFYLKSTSSKNSFLSLMHTSINQGLTIKDEIYNDEDFIFQDIDKNVRSYGLKSEVEEIKNLYNVDFIEYLNPFKALYFLLKNQSFNATSLFVLKFSQSSAVIVANKNKVIFSTMLDFIDESYEALKKDPDNFSLEDDYEIFCSILQNFLVKFYAEQSEFIEEIFIYDTSNKNRELGYYIFTKLFIKTSVFPIDIAEYINKINIKENF